MKNHYHLSTKAGDSMQLVKHKRKQLIFISDHVQIHPLDSAGLPVMVTFKTKEKKYTVECYYSRSLSGRVTFQSSGIPKIEAI